MTKAEHFLKWFETQYGVGAITLLTITERIDVFEQWNARVWPRVRDGL